MLEKEDLSVCHGTQTHICLSSHQGAEPLSTGEGKETPVAKLSSADLMHIVLFKILRLGCVKDHTETQPA